MLFSKIRKLCYSILSRPPVRNSRIFPIPPMLHFTFRFLLPHQRENTRRDCNFTKSFFLSQSYKIPVKRKNKAKWTSKDKKPPRPCGPNGICSISVRSTRQTTKQRQNYRYICRPILCSIFFLKAKSQTRKILVCDRDSNAFHLYLLLLGPSVPRQKAEQKKAPLTRSTFLIPARVW